MVGQRGFQKSAPPRGFDGQTGIVTSRREQAERSRALLVSIALDLFVSQGYEATSIAQIQEQANMARGALYHHFPDGKLSLFNAVVDLVDQQLHDGFERIMNDIDSPVEQIVAGFDLVLDLATDPVFARIILIEAAVVMPGAWTDGSEFQLLQHNLELAMANGELRTQPLGATASVLYGAARRSADYVARADYPHQAAADAKQVLRTLVEALKS